MNAYADLEQYKDWFDVTTTTNDAVIVSMLEAVSRHIDHICGRRFYPATETRYYTASDSAQLFVDDLLSVTTLKTDEDGDRTYEITWQTTDYDLMPYNASTDGVPYTWIEVAPDGDYNFPATRKGVELAGSFGYCTAANRPYQIMEACLLGAHRMYTRHDTPLGVSASPTLGQMQVIVRELGTDPDFMALLAPFRRLV